MWRGGCCARLTWRRFRAKGSEPASTFGCRTPLRKLSWIAGLNGCGSFSRRCNAGLMDALDHRFCKGCSFANGLFFGLRFYGKSLSIVDASGVRSASVGDARFIADLPQSQVRREDRRSLAERRRLQSSQRAADRKNAFAVE